MQSRRQKKPILNRGRIIVFALVLLLLAGTVLLRFVQEKQLDTADQMNPADHSADSTTGFTETSVYSSEPEIPEEAAAVTETPAATDGETSSGADETEQSLTAQQETEQASENNGESRIRSGNPYNEQTYQIVTDIVYTMRHQGEDGIAGIRQLLTELNSADPALGALWEGIVDYWFYVSTEMPIYRGVLPDGLPEDDSLCIAVLGFQLMYDGDMAPELVGRCETALACAGKYPNAYILVTGGGTAYGNRGVTEAGVMADWMQEHGIAAERIIIEDASLTTDQNASYSCRILTEQYPQIRQIAIVSSDYHVALGSMLFTEAALLYSYENDCEPPYQVVSNAGYATSGNPEYSNPRHFSSDIWIMADPKL